MHVPHVVDAESGYTLIKKTPSFFEQHLKVSYKFDIGREYRIQIHSGVQNIFNSYQRDFDRGASRDAAYVYGPNRPRTIFMGIKFVFQGSNWTKKIFRTYCLDSALHLKQIEYFNFFLLIELIIR